MADDTQTTEATTPPVESQNRFKQFISNHPRAAKVAGFTAAGLAAVGAVVLVTRNSDSELVQGEVVTELPSSASETPTSTEA